MHGLETLQSKRNTLIYMANFNCSMSTHQGTYILTPGSDEEDDLKLTGRIYIVIKFIKSRSKNALFQD